MAVLETVLALALAAPAVQDDRVFSGARVLKLADEVRPLVERETGTRFRTPPLIKLASRGAVRRAVRDDQERLLRVIRPDLKGRELRQAATQLGEAFAPTFLGKYLHTERAIYVVPENFASLADELGRPALKSEAFLRTILIHETVHAADQEAYGAVTRLFEAKDAEALQVAGAVTEGHAQFVTRRILAAEGREEIFRTFEGLITSDPPGLTEAEKLMTRIVTAQFRFSYVQGRAFFEEIHRTGKQSAVVRALRTPPTRISQISRPGTWLDPGTAAKRADLSGLWRDLEQRHGPEWTGRPSTIDEMRIRAACRQFVTKDDLDASMKGFEAAWGLSLVPSTGDAQKAITYAVVQLDTEASARAFHGFKRRLSEAKDRKLSEGPLRIADARYGTLAGAGAFEHAYVVKTVATGNRSMQVRTVFARVGRFEVEIMAVGGAITDAGLLGSLERMRAGLQGK